MKRVLLTVGLMMAIVVSAQEARVIELSKNDTYDVQQAWLNLQSAQRQWDAVQQRVTDKYLRVPYGDKDEGREVVGGALSITSGTFTMGNVLWSSGSSVEPTPKEQAALELAAQEAAKEREDRRRHAMYERKGWENGFTFTDDFRFIVPKSAPIYVPCAGGSFGGGCYLNNGQIQVN